MTWTNRAERLADAQRQFKAVMTTPGPAEPTFAYYDAGVVGFVFGEMWPRPGLTRKERRWVTLACVATTGVAIPVQTHVYAALASGDCTLEEMDEFGLHVATQLGWPRGQNINMCIIQAVAQMAKDTGEPARTPVVVPWADPSDLDGRIERGRLAYEEIMLTAAPSRGDDVPAARLPGVSLRRGLDPSGPDPQGTPHRKHLLRGPRRSGARARDPPLCRAGQR